MNLVDKLKDISTFEEMRTVHSFAVQYNDTIKKYYISYEDDGWSLYVCINFMKKIMQRRDIVIPEQLRLVFKRRCQLRIVNYSRAEIPVFDSKYDCHIAMRNLLLYIDRKHGNISGRIIKSMNSY